MKRKDAEFKCVYAGPEMMSRRFSKPVSQDEADKVKTTVCPFCKESIPDEGNYCPYCGNMLKPDLNSIPPQPFATYAGPPVTQQGQNGAFYMPIPPYPANYQTNSDDAHTVYAGPPIDVYAGPPIEPDEDE